MRTRLRSLVQAALVVIAFLNLWQLNGTLRWVKPREDDDVVIAEDRLRFIRDALMKAGYWRGDVGYMPEGVLNGHARTKADDSEWVVVRYVLIPWNVIQDSLEPPFVLVDGRRTGRRIETPQGFTKVYESKEGLTLLRKLRTP
jgi:hypothetical protein